jgi:hypothetical protein
MFLHFFKWEMMAKGHGGKRLGAGRKAKKPGTGDKPGAKSAYFATRITPETKAALELEAQVSGKTVSRVAEMLLEEALDQRRTNERNNPTRALSYLIGELADIVAPAALKMTNFASDWRHDPFLFETYKLSIVRVMDALRPAGDVTSPLDRQPALEGATNVWGPLDTPEKRAEYAAFVILHNLNSAREPLQLVKSLGEHRPADDKTPYDLHRAWRGLNMEPKK